MSLHLAWCHGISAFARVLFERDVDALAREKGEGTLLHVAAIAGHVEVARFPP